MQEAKHTPGPWRYEKGTCGEHSIGTDGAWFEIARSSHHRDAEANACLIAASPELLEALQKVKMDAVGIGHGENVISDATRTAVYAAIAKATALEGEG